MDNDWDALTEKVNHIATLNELFAFMQLLLDEITFDWVDKNENWLMIAHQLKNYGETDLADLFELANQRAFQLSLKTPH